MTKLQLQQAVRKFMLEGKSFTLSHGESVPQEAGVSPEDARLIGMAVLAPHFGKVVLDSDSHGWSLTLMRGSKDIGYLAHDTVGNSWYGGGPSEKEFDMFGSRHLGTGQVGRVAATDFARNFGTTESMLGRGIKRFFSFGDEDAVPAAA